MFNSDAEGICLYQGQELGLNNPTKEQLPDARLLELDAQTAMRYIKGEGLDALRPLSRANARVHLPMKEYAKQEQNEDARPEFLPLEYNPEDYDVIFIGYPMWWYTIPMLLDTFFDSYDFTGKTLIPFNTHEGSRDGGTWDTIRDLEPGATVPDGIAIRGRDAADEDTKDQILAWLAGLDLEP